MPRNYQVFSSELLPFGRNTYDAQPQAPGFPVSFGVLVCPFRGSFRALGNSENPGGEGGGSPSFIVGHSLWIQTRTHLLLLLV